jgi:glycogen operon protein
VLAFCLRGESQQCVDLYVMINAHSEDMDFKIREVTPGEWLCVVDTALDSPDDIVEPGQDAGSVTGHYYVRARSVVVLAQSAASPYRSA